MNKYGNELKEVCVILNTLMEDDYNKIPKNTIQAIEENMNDDYEYEIIDNPTKEEGNAVEKIVPYKENVFKKIVNLML